MSWVFLAIVSAGALGTMNTIEKVLATKYLPDSSTLIAWFGFSQIVFIIPFVILFPLDEGTPALRALSVVASGFMFGLGFSIVLYVIRTAEASRAFPIFNTSPIFVALYSVVILGRHLDAVKWGAIVLTILGAVLITLDVRGGTRFKLDRSFFLLMFAAILVAGDFLFASYGLEDINPTQGLWLQRLGALLPLAIWWNRRTFKNFVASLRSPKVLGLAVTSELVLGAVSQLALLAALETGPVSLVSAILATTPVWIFVFSTVISTPFIGILNEVVERRSLVFKTAAIGMTVVGTVGVVVNL